MTNNEPTNVAIQSWCKEDHTDKTQRILVFSVPTVGGINNPERSDGYRHNYASDGGACAQYGGQHHRRVIKGCQYTPSTPSVDQFHLDTQKRLTRLQDGGGSLCATC